MVIAQLSLIQPDVDELRIQALSFYIYPEYEEVYHTNDLALIKVNQPIPYGPHVNFIYYEEANDTDTSATVMGWGATQVFPFKQIKTSLIF